MIIYFISPNGNNANDGLTEQTALLNLDNAVTKAVDGDEICFLEGRHIMKFASGVGFVDIGLASALVFDRGKVLTIYSRSPGETILDGTGQTSELRDAHAISIKAASNIRNLNIIFEPKKAINYSNAIFGWCGANGKVTNCNFQIIGNSSQKSYNYSVGNGFSVVNCNFRVNDPQPVGDYSTGQKFINNILPGKIIATSNTYRLDRQATSEDLISIAFDCFQLGDPNILNSDGSRSHIGIFGGIYGDIWNLDVPQISGEDINIGGQDNKPQITYQVSAISVITINEYINNELTRTIFQAPHDADINFYFPNKIWHMLDKSPSQMKIVASNLSGSSTRTIEFTRNIYKIDVKDKAQITPNRAVNITITDIDTTALPENVTLKVSNNAFDDTPVWETVIPGQPHTFSNTAKTALNWGLSIWAVAELGTIDNIRVYNIDAIYTMEA